MIVKMLLTSPKETSYRYPRARKRLLPLPRNPKLEDYCIDTASVGYSQDVYWKQGL